MERKKSGDGGGGLALAVCVFLTLFSARFAGGHPTVMCAQVGAGRGNWKPEPQPGLEYVPGKHFIPHLGWEFRTGYFSIGAKKYDNNYTAVWRNTAYHVFVFGGPIYPAEIFVREIPRDVNSPFKHPECPYMYEPMVADWVNPCDVDIHTRRTEFEMKVYAVKQTGMDGVERALAGWLHIELQLVDPDDEIRIVYLQMRDEYFNAIGEFVMDSAEQCPSNDEDVFVSPTNKQFLPCTATGLRETTPSQALYMVSREILDDETVKDPANGYIPVGGLKRGIHVTWRFGEYWCNRHFMIRPDAFILTKRMIEKRAKFLEEHKELYEIPRFSSPSSIKLNSSWDYPRWIRKTPKYWLRADWFGAHDIKTGSGPLKCNEEILDDNTGKPTGAAPWIINSNKSTLYNDYLNPENYYKSSPSEHSLQSCQADPQATPPEDAAVFTGRCVHLYQTVVVTGRNITYLRPSQNQLHTCNTGSKEFEGINVTFESYKNYTADLQTNRSIACNSPCRGPLNTVDVDDIKIFNVSGIRGLKFNKSSSSHNDRTSDSLIKFWRGRKFHGILCIICTMFLTPVSLFAARYYKETAMKHVFAGLQIWYWIHVANSLGLFAIYYSSQMAIGPSIASWGHSEDPFATSHYVIGWISHAIFTAMLFIGGIRGGIVGSSVKIRKVIMTAHSVVGFAQYGINIILVIISTWIPASPTADACGEDGFPTGLSSVAILTITWAALDILFHGAITFLQVTGDQKLGFKRPWYCPIVPVVASDSMDDMAGSFVRQIVFIVYVVFSGGFMFSTILTLGLSEQVPGCIFGEMTCKAPLGCTSTALAMCKNLQYTNCDG